MADAPDSPSFEFYTVTIEEFDGTTWTTIHTPKSSYGTSAVDCAVKVLQHDWPVSVYDKDPDQVAWRTRWERLKNRADTVRFTVVPTAYSKYGDSVTLLLRDLLAALLARELAEQEQRRLAAVAARAALKEAQGESQYRTSLHRGAAYDIEQTLRHMAAVGMSEADIAAARKAGTPSRPRAPRKSSR
jgi:hypothetical protein